MAASHQQEPWLLENGNPKVLTREMRHGRTAHSKSSNSLRKKSDRTLVSKVPCATLRNVLLNLQEVLLGTKLSILIPAIPAAIVAEYCGFGRVSSSSHHSIKPVKHICFFYMSPVLFTGSLLVSILVPMFIYQSSISMDVK